MHETMFDSLSESQVSYRIKFFHLEQLEQKLQYQRTLMIEKDWLDLNFNYIHNNEYFKLTFQLPQEAELASHNFKEHKATTCIANVQIFATNKSRLSRSNIFLDINHQYPCNIPYD